ncbi:hypothetical protein Ocin01_16023, partial [Orchesella cincta]
IFRILILIISLVSHYESDWRKIYKIFDVSKWTYDFPRLSMEEYYVAMNNISFILSLVSLGTSLIIGMPERRKKMVDFGYHILIALLLLIAGSVYITSTKELKDTSKHVTWFLNGEKSKLLIGLKMFAGSLAIIQTALYVVVALFI